MKVVYVEVESDVSVVTLVAYTPAKIGAQYCLFQLF